MYEFHRKNGQPSQYSAPSRGGGRGGFRGGGTSSRGRGRGVGAGGRGGAGVAAGGRGGRGGGARGGGRGAGGRGGRPPQVQPKPQFLAWCELCRVDCNTHEVLENHKNGKKHKKNLEIQEDLRKLAARTNEAQMPPPTSTAMERPPEVKFESQTVPPSEEQNNLKRKMVEEERKSVEPMKKPKESVPVPFICELCDVKCESAPVFDCHLKGRKHSFNLQRFQEQQAALGQVALQALYPALEAALYPVLIQALAQNASTSYGYGGLDQQVLQLLQPYLPQNGPGYHPPGPGFQPHRGPNPGVTIQPVEERVEPVNGTEDKVEAENGSKSEDGVGPESKVEEPEVKTEEQKEPEQAGPIAGEGTE